MQQLRMRNHRVIREKNLAKCKESRLGRVLRMPGKKGFCWCLGSTAPPDIQHTGFENGGMTLKPIQADLPMPQDEDELNNKFSELVDELGLDKPHREAMFNLSPEKKWQIYCSKKREQDDTSPATGPDYYIEQIKLMTKQVFLAPDDEEIESRADLIDSLKTGLRTQPMSFVMRFIEREGLQAMLDLLVDMDYKTSMSNAHTSIIGCIKAMMNNSEGRAHVLGHNDCINIIAQSLSTDNIKAKVAVLEMLGAVCLVPGGHRKVLQAMLHYQKFAAERTRFQSLVNDLDRTTGMYKDEVNLKTAIMSFINAALKYGAGQNHLEFRLHLRYELLMLGIQPVIEKLKKFDNITLNKHLEFFEMVRIEDERQLAKRFDLDHVDSKSATVMFDLLRKKLHYTGAYPHLLSILYHLLQLPFGNGLSVQHWHLVDRVIQQIVLQTKEGDPDVAPTEVNVKKIIKQLANESEIKEFQSKMREIQKENDELASKLTKKERECSIKDEEKEEMISTLNSMQSRLEKEQIGHNEAMRKLDELYRQVEELQRMVEAERGERVKLEHAVKTGSLPDDAKMGVTSALLSSVNLSSSIPPPPQCSIPPPPPPPLGGPPPPPAPPPPPGGAPLMPGSKGSSSLTGYPGTAQRKKNVPAAKQALKSFNWSKLPENQIKGTVWSDLDDVKIYPSLDLDEFEHTFSAYQRHEGSDSDIFNKAKAKELSVIDGRRAQNCTILLSKLKMSNQELANAIMKMDPQEELPKDMCEQLLKFVPTPEECQMLSEHEHEIEEMAKADRFLYEMSKIDHYEQRLKALFFKKKFSERMSECKPKVEAVLQASKEVYRSRRLKRILEIVLAFGNYMNKGQRGNASGFRISSLNKIIDTKSSIDKRITLLHYLLDTIEFRFPDLLRLNDDMKNVQIASKVNMTELEAEVNVLRSGLKDINQELEYHKKLANLPEYNRTQDRFVHVMRDFVTVASYNFSELEDNVKEMKEKYQRCCKAFGDDPQKSQPDEFFATFNLFVVSYGDARKDNDRLRKQKEEEEKKAIIEAKLKAEKATRLATLGRRKGSGANIIENEEKGEFDDLISALRTGDVFTEDYAKLKSRNRRRSSQPKAENVSRERLGLKGRQRAN